MAGSSEASPPNFAEPGPCGAQSWQPSFSVPQELRKGGLPRSLRLNVTIPGCGAAASPPFGSPAPVVVFYNGFQNKASWYHLIVQQLASWGLAVVQYDTPIFPLVTVAAELDLFPALVQWVGEQANDTASPLYQKVDPSRLATSGHSRGGKLAALAFATYPDLVAASYLVDPVDVTKYSPESKDYPSAARALASSGRAVGIAAAGIVSSCNPAEGNYEVMYAAAGNSSWLGVVLGASHSTFADAGCVGNVAADLLCGRGKDSRPQVAGLTSPQMLAWLWGQLVGQQEEVPPADSPLPGFFAWVQQQQAQGLLDFEVKGEVEAEWAEVAASQAPPSPTYPTAAEEEAACVGSTV